MVSFVLSIVSIFEEQKFQHLAITSNQEVALF